MKKIEKMKGVRFILFLISILILCSCSSKQAIYDYMSVYYKKNVHSAKGRIAAEYDEKVYYFSSEGSTPGVYCMNLDGTDVRQILECDDICGIQIVDQVMYVSVLQKERIDNRKIYILKAISLGDKQEMDALDDVISQKYAAYDGFSGVSDFYVKDADHIFISVNGYEENRKKIDTTTFYQETGSVAPIFEKSKRVSKSDDMVDGNALFIYQNEDSFFASTSTNEDLDLYNKESKETVSAHNVYGYDCKNDEVWWNDDKLGNRWGGRFKIWGIVNENLVVTSDEGRIFLYSTKEQKITWQMKLDGKGEISYVDTDQTSINVIWEEDIPSAYEKRDDRSHQKLYHLDLKDKKIKLVKEYNTNGKILHIRGNNLIDYDEGKLRFVSVEEPDKVKWSHTLEEHIKTIGYQVEIVADWILIKMYDTTKNSAELVEKIRVAN